MPTQPARLVHSLVPAGVVLNDRWVVGDVVGLGADDDVYSVRDSTNICQNVVIRFPGNRADHLERTLLREASFLSALNRLTCEGSFTEHALGFHHGTLYVVMPSNYKISYSDDVLSTRTILGITRRVFQVIERLHKNRVVHGDIREENVLLGLRETTPNTYLINFEDPEEFTRESEIADIWYLMDMMVRMFRNGKKGVLPEGEMCILPSDKVSDVQRHQVLRNLLAAYEYRESIRNPIPGEVSELISELLDEPLSYERVKRLLRRAEASPIADESN